MRPVSREHDAAFPRWVDEGRLGWTPDEPLQTERRTQPRSWRQSAGFRLKRGLAGIFRRPSRAGLKIDPQSPSRRLWSEAIKRKPKRQTEPRDTKNTISPSRKSAPKPGLLALTDDGGLRLAIGLVQGAALALLLLAQRQGLLPGHAALLANALVLSGAIAPLALLEGLGQVPLRPLLLWSGTLGCVIATFGLWHLARGELTAMPVAGVALFALLAHIAMRAVLQHGRAWTQHGNWTRTARAIGVRFSVWGAVTALALLALTIGNAMLGAFGFDLSRLTLPIGLPLLGLASAAGFAFAADGRSHWRPHHMLGGCVAILPVLDAAALALLGLYFLNINIAPGAVLSMAAAVLVLHGLVYLAESFSRPRARG